MIATIWQVFQLSIFVLAIWLGMYLAVRDPSDLRLRWTSLGLLAYAIALATLILEGKFSPDPLVWRRISLTTLLLPVLFWTGALIQFLPPSSDWATRMQRLWFYGQLPTAILTLLLAILRPDNSLHLWLLVLVLLPMLASFTLVSVAAMQEHSPNAMKLLLLATTMFILSVGLLLFANDDRISMWLIPAIGFDLLLFGYAIAALDAFEQGETLLPDLLRSFDSALLACLVFGIPIGLTIGFTTVDQGALWLLLLITLTAAVAMQTYNSKIERSLDRVAFNAMPALQLQREALRTTANALPKLDTTLDVLSVDEKEFARLTRRALSNLGNVPRLASSPLTQMPIVEYVLQQEERVDTSLERATVVKSLLTEAILHLKPDHDTDFDTSDAWRHYNALYFPYVVGLKPYSRRAAPMDIDGTTQQALEWFRSQVPERTLYNWQNAAAHLISQHLLEITHQQTN